MGKNAFVSSENEIRGGKRKELFTHHKGKRGERGK
jgi:hypothetical protein